MALLKLFKDLFGDSFKWITNSRCVFELDGIRYGIYLKFSNVYHCHGLATTLTCVNVCFGQIVSEFLDETALVMHYENLKKPNALFNIVTDALSVYPFMGDYDVICVVALGDSGIRGNFLYSNKFPEILAAGLSIRDPKIFKTLSPASEIMTIISKIDFDAGVKELIRVKLGFKTSTY